MPKKPNKPASVLDRFTQPIPRAYVPTSEQTSKAAIINRAEQEMPVNASWRDRVVDPQIKKAPAPKGKAAKVWNAVTNPVTAIQQYNEKGYLPDNFTSGERNSLDFASDAVNPAAWANYAYHGIKNAPSDLVEGIKSDGDFMPLAMDALSVLPIAAGIKSIGKGVGKFRGREIPTTEPYNPVHQNLKDLEYAKQHFQQYGYDMPTNLEELAQSNELTDNTIKGLVDQHNTFTRGVSTNWAEVEKNSPQVLRHLEDKGIDWKNNPEEAAKYMGTHIPIGTNYGRAGLNQNVFQRGLEGLYTSNSMSTAEGYTYGDGYIVKGKRPTDFSSTNRQDWIHKNDVNYFERKLPDRVASNPIEAKQFEQLAKDAESDIGYSQKKKELYQKMVNSPDPSRYLHHKYPKGGLEKMYPEHVEKGYYTVDDNKLTPFLPKPLLPAYRAIVGTGGQMFSTAEEALQGMKGAVETYDYRIQQAKDRAAALRPYHGELEGKILKTEYNNNTFGEQFSSNPNGFGAYTAENIAAKLQGKKPSPFGPDGSDPHIKNILDLTKSVGKKYNPQISEILEGNGTAEQRSQQVDALRQLSRKEVFESHKNYLSENFPGWENQKENYAHYIHIGTPGQQVLEPLETIRVTPETWANRSRAHTGTYTKGLSAAAVAGIGIGVGMTDKTETMKKKKWGGVIDKAEYGWNDPMLNNGLSRGYEQQHQTPQLQPIGMQQMPVQPVAPQPLPVPQENTPMPAAAPRTKPKGKTFTTPGTGDLIAGSIGLANALLPNQVPNDYHQPQYGSYNANAYGTGSTALYDEGGMIPSYKQRFTSKEGGIKVTQEVPTNLGYGNVQPDNIPLATPQFTSGPKHISYESLNTVGQRQVFSPKFQGFSPGEIRNQWNSIPQQIGGKEVLRGQAWEDLQGGQPHSPIATKQYQPIFSNNNVSIDTADTHYSAYHPETAPRWSFEDGGKLEVGQKLTLSPVERLKLEAAGYRFK